MKAKVKTAYFDTCLRQKGEIVEVKNLDPILHEAIEEKKVVEPKKATKKTTKK